MSIKFRLGDNSHKLNLQSEGTFLIGFEGGYSARNIGDFKCQLRSLKSGEIISLIDLKLKPRFFFDRKRSIGYYKFKIETPDLLEIKFENIYDLEVHNSALFLSRLFFSTKVDLERINVFIKNW